MAREAPLNVLVHKTQAELNKLDRRVHEQADVIVVGGEVTKCRPLPRLDGTNWKQAQKVLQRQEGHRLAINASSFTNRKYRP